MSQIDFDWIIREVYGEIPSPDSNTDSESSSPVFLDIQMEATWSLIYKEVLSYNHITIDESYISKHRSNILVSLNGNEDVILTHCVDGESVFITWPKRVSDEYFYFYSGVIEDFKIRIPFTDFVSSLLKTLNIAPFKLRPNG